MIGPARGFRTPSPAETQVARLPAPTKGIDARAPVGSMDPMNCLYAYNLMPAEYGMLLRNGYREWATEVTSGASIGIRTLLVFDGLASTALDDRLFAMTNEGIWDVTTFDSAPILKIAFPDPTGDAGHGVYCHYIDQSGDAFVFYADSVNGLYQYTEATDIWEVATGITGTDPSTEDLDLSRVAFVVVHKLRLWLIEDEKTYAWYLPIASKNGIAKPFFFGPKFSHGGKLAALFNWSVDGGAGLDDYLVAVSSSGDVLPYQGSDPSAAEGGELSAWQVRGTYFIGKVPVGRRFASEYAGNLYLLSSFGIISMRDLLQGVDTTDVTNKSLSFKITRPLRSQLLKTIDQLGWEPRFLPSQGQLTISSPENARGNYIQYSMNLSTEGWGIWRGVPIECFAEWNGKTYIGTADNRVCVMDVFSDNQRLDPEAPLREGVPIEFSVLTAYTDAGSGGVFKRGQYIREDFLAALPPVTQSKLLYDYNIAELIVPEASPSEGVSLWDIGLWDSAVWASTDLQGYARVGGTGGIGRTMAVAMRGTAITETRLISWDIMWVVGGMM